MSFFRLYGRVLTQLRPVKATATMLVVANLALASAQFAEPLLYGRVIDRLSTAQQSGLAATWGDVAPLLAAWTGFAVFSIVAGILVALHADRLVHSRRVGVMAAYFEHVLHLPMSFHASAHSGRLLKIMIEGSAGMFGVWLAFFREHCASLVSLFVLLPLTLFKNWRLGAILIARVFVFGAVMNFVIRRTETMQTAADEVSANLAERVSDVLGNMPVVQSFARVEEETREMRRMTERLLSAQFPVLTWWAIASVATRASATLALLAIFLLGVWLHMRGMTSVGEIATFMGLATMLIGRLEQIVGFVNFLFGQAPKLAQFFEVLDTSSNVVDRPGAAKVAHFQGHVRFEDVSFAYDARRDAVRGLTFDAPPGTTLALVGATGSGKSTTLALLHRVYDPTRGRITVDGRDIRELTLASLRGAIGVVFQEPFIFARSIEENLRIGKPDANMSEIAEALRRAQASDFVSEQPRGLETVIGEHGRNLSGGERQRLAIARALLKDPPIMILDEATSALDAATERQLQGALDEATRGRTTFVIAHRLSTIRRADRILVFDRGEVVESGTFDSLVAEGGVFARLARAQFMHGESELAAP
ncbi:MAG TPA: glucan ABC transporter ATP-binding protein/ permease [Roseiarcus sp.]|jgi:ATP-binding cassette subfamily B protein